MENLEAELLICKGAATPCDQEVNVALAQFTMQCVRPCGHKMKNDARIAPREPIDDDSDETDFQVQTWNGLFAPKGTPRPILDRLTDALDQALDDERTRNRIFDLGSDIPSKTERGQTPLAALVKSEIARWSPIIKAANK